MKIYYVQLEDELQGIYAISLVRHPAVKEDFICLSSENVVGEIKLSAFDHSKHIISGVALLADTPIKRFSPAEGGTYYITFPKDEIRKIVEKVFVSGGLNNINLQHDSEQLVNNKMNLIESYIIDRERGISPVEFQNVTDGSWIVSYKITDDALWEEIVNGSELNGFSIEGRFKFSLQKDDETEYNNWIKNLTK